MITYSVINLNRQKVLSFYSKMHHLINLGLFVSLCTMFGPNSSLKSPNPSLEAQILAWRPISQP